MPDKEITVYGNNMTIKCRLKACYSIKHPALGFYLGTARGEKGKNFSLKPTKANPAWLYSKKDAHEKMARFPEAFKGCKIVYY
tara:strand:+ start:1128 stop:1376 length:249 start_codon:yes stop_codon:yes gene_type:complete